MDNNFEQHFWNKVDNRDDPKGDWIWTGDKDTYYGRDVQRIAYELSNDVELKDTDTVYARCSEPKCLNPDHLTLEQPTATSPELLDKSLSKEVRRQVSSGTSPYEVARKLRISPATVMKLLRTR